MVKVRGPLFSSQASGSIGNGAIQYRSTKTGPQAVIPSAGKPSTGRAPTKHQATVQATFQLARDAWSALSAEEKANWAHVADTTNAPNGWSAFLSRFMTGEYAPWEALRTPPGLVIRNAAGLALLV
jgi:hypothetical protein